MQQECELVTRLKHREKGAFENLYCNYSKALYTVLLSMLKDAALCEDLLQDVYIKIWNHIDQYDGGKGSLFTWMASIAKNVARDAMESRWFKNRRNTASLEEALEKPCTNVDAQLHQIPVKKYVDHLGQTQKIVVMLSFYYGYTQAEIAQLMHAPLGTIKTWNRKALQQIKTNITKAEFAYL